MTIKYIYFLIKLKFDMYTREFLNLFSLSKFYFKNFYLSNFHCLINYFLSKFDFILLKEDDLPNLRCLKYSLPKVYI